MPLPSSGGGSYVSLPGSKPPAGTSGARAGGRSLNPLPSPSRELVRQRVERQPARDRQRRDDLRAADEVHRLRPAVVAPREVAVVGGHDRVGHAVHQLLTLPLPDARAARVRQHDAVDVLQGVHLTVALDGGAYLLRARRHHEVRRGREAVSAGLPRDVGGSAHVLVRGVRAAPDQRRVDPVDEVVRAVCHLGCQRRDRTRPVRRVRPHDVWLEA